MPTDYLSFPINAQLEIYHILWSSSVISTYSRNSLKCFRKFAIVFLTNATASSLVICPSVCAASDVALHDQTSNKQNKSDTHQLYHLVLNILNKFLQISHLAQVQITIFDCIIIIFL